MLPSHSCRVRCSTNGGSDLVRRHDNLRTGPLSKVAHDGGFNVDGWHESDSGGEQLLYAARYSTKTCGKAEYRKVDSCGQLF